MAAIIVLRPDRRQPAELVPAWRCSSSSCSALLGFTIGYAIFGDAGRRASATTAVRARRSAALSGVGDLLRGRQARPRRSAARARSTTTSRAAADERRPRDGDRGERADARGLHHRRHGAERLRDRPRPGARLDRDHDRPAREARPRGAPGRHRPRAVARPQPRHPVLARRRRHGRGDRDPRRLLPALHVLGRRWAASREPRQRRGRRRPGDHLRRRHRRWPSSRRSSAGSSSSPSAASASTSPTPRRSS